MKTFYVWLLATVVSIGSVEADDLAEGISAYKSYNFGSSIESLSKAVNGSHSKDPIAHYYLGSAYSELSNKSAALLEYRKCLRLCPKADIAALCNTAIKNLTTLPTQVTKVDKVPATASDLKSVAPGVESAPIKFVGLPPIPPFVKDDGPSLSEVQSWSNAQQASYYQTASGRRSDARSRLEQMREVLNRAQAIALSMVPTVRQFGETEDATKARVTRGREQVDAALKPYQDALALRQREVDQAGTIYDTCISAVRRIAGY